MRRLLPSLLLLTLSVLTTASCFKAPPPVVSRSQAETKFLSLCRDEYKLEPVTRQVGNTFWIYLPFEEPFLEYKANAEGPTRSDKKTEKSTVHFLKVDFEKGTFRLRYDISPAKKYGQDYGYANTYTEAFQAINRQITTAIGRAFFDMGEVPGDVTYTDPKQNATHQALVDAHLDPEAPPEFFVVALADIKGGLVVKSILYLPDLKRTMSSIPSIPQEEFALRYLSEVYGQQSLIGDKKGKNLDYREIGMGEFLAKQIEKRVSAKFTAPDSDPAAAPEDEILPIIRQTLEYYGFSQLDSVALHNLNDDSKYLFSRDQLAQY